MSIAEDLQQIIETALDGPLPLQIRAWDGSSAGRSQSGATVVFRNSTALRRLLWAPNQIGLARAYVAGDLDFEGDIFEIIDLPDVVARIARHQPIGLSKRQLIGAARTAVSVGAVGLPPAPPPEEVRRRSGPLHSILRDSASVSHHYDVGNDFYRLVLGPSMVYSCAYWTQPPGPDYGVDQAQHDKCALVCSKLGLAPGMRLLDVGCGWGTLAMHAAAEHGASVVGVTLSVEQARMARERVAEAGLSDLVEIRVQDYRHVDDGPFDAIASIGMAEHVGRAQLAAYSSHLAGLLRPGGRLLNHAIASVRPVPTSAGPKQDTFIGRYIFPDGELVPLSTMADAIEQAELEIRDVEALREHYGLTLRAWVANLLQEWEQAQQLVSPSRARAWLLYLAAAALAFDHGNLTVHQIVAVRQGDLGRSDFPLTRARWLSEQSTV